ncbi:MAG: hypothetical protein ACXWQ5_07925 [Ktedonobacterales bacterium]
MRKVAQFLHVASRVLAICAVLAGLAAGLLTVSVVAAFICFDSCPTREDFFSSRVLPGTVQFMMPCVVLEVLALAVFLAYCVATHQPRRTIAPILFFLIGGLVGVAALDALLQHGQATLPNEDGILLEGPVEAWVQLWGWVLLLVAGAWSGVLAYLQWRR